MLTAKKLDPEDLRAALTTPTEETLSLLNHILHLEQINALERSLALQQDREIRDANMRLARQLSQHLRLFEDLSKAGLLDLRIDENGNYLESVWGPVCH